MTRPYRPTPPKLLQDTSLQRYEEMGIPAKPVIHALLCGDLARALTLVDHYRKDDVVPSYEWITRYLAPAIAGSAEAVQRHSEATMTPEARAVAEAEASWRAAKAVVEEKEAGVRSALACLPVTCESTPVYGQGCGAVHRVKDLTYIETQDYHPPRGCTEGDYYTEGEGYFDCPACGRRNRLYYRPHIQSLKWHFARVVDAS